jgi:hypothetical protein
MQADVSMWIRGLIIWYLKNRLCGEEFDPIARTVGTRVSGNEVDPGIERSDMGRDVPPLSTNVPHVMCAAFRTP